METFNFGQTALGLPILGYKFGSSGPRVLILGGVHGNEHEGVVASLGLIQKFQNHFDLKATIYIVPQFNLDGVLNKERRNARGVDLNRNLPTRDWTDKVSEEKYNPGPSPCSEPENKALVDFLDNIKPQYIYSMHSWQPCININADSRPEAEVIAEITGYKITEDIGYPTPGCLGTYTGHERGIPTITYEIERGLDHPSTLKTHVEAVYASLKLVEKRFK